MTMINLNRRFQQLYLSFFLLSVFNLALWACFLTLYTRHEHRQDDYTLSESQRLSKKQGLQMIRKWLEMNSKIKLDKYSDGRNLTQSKSVQRRPSVEEIHGKTTNAWITPATMSTKDKQWDTVQVISKNVIKEIKDESALSLPSQETVAEVLSIEIIQSVNNDDNARQDENHETIVQEVKEIDAQHKKSTASEAMNKTKVEMHDDSYNDHKAEETKTKTKTKPGFLKQLSIINMTDFGGKKRHVLIVIFVLTSPLRYNRRQGIRNTWWTKCKDPQAVCLFATDGHIDETLYDGLLKEKEKYNDILFLPVEEGLNFGMRLLYLMKWVQTKYKPEFFLRIDDDYFLCIERLLHELPQRPKNNVVSGFWHCDSPTTTFMDESFMLLSYDLVEKFLSWNEKTLLCHPFGDQQLGIWLNNLGTFNSSFDFRLHHDPPASKNAAFTNISNICDRYLGLHGTYPEHMRKFWSRANDGKKALTKWIPLYPNACPYTPYLKWQGITPKYRFKPKLCANNPRWSSRREMWAGRQ